MNQQTATSPRLLLGCIADDITGATDLGLQLSSHGLPTSLYLGIPLPDQISTTEAVIIALKIRTVPAARAVAQASRAADWLLGARARQLFYKYCSTFDSTDKGNIGPIANALLEKVGARMTVLLPAFPKNKRTVNSGHLYVGDVPLNESSMRDHPLTPMTDSYLPALMDAQTHPGLTAAIHQDVVDEGVGAIGKAMAELAARGSRYISIDATSERDLQVIADATIDLKLLTGSSGIAGAIPQTLRTAGILAGHTQVAYLPARPGHAAILAGSCSAVTRAQVALFSHAATKIIVDPIAISNKSQTREALARTAVDAAHSGDILVYSSTEPGDLKYVQDTLGVARSADLVEKTLAYIAEQLAASGVRKFVVAGGESSGAVAAALGIFQLHIAREIDPGVPWMVTTSNDPICIAFKSGNFGRPDFFRHALAMLP